MSDTFQQLLARNATAIGARLDKILTAQNQARPERLVAAMRHGVLNGGKRVRPFLVLQSAALFGIREDQAMQTACALECIHCYSLIHDDLPAMDDDDLRRGKPTVHRAFDEATAILAGDALLTLAFELVTVDDNPLPADVRAALAGLLARAAGQDGMIGGQVLDIAAERETPDEAGIRLLQAMKTGALLRFACEAGAVMGQAERSRRDALVQYGETIGLAFQLADDLLDVAASPQQMGKATGKDAQKGKGTLVSLHGPDKVQTMLNDLVKEADAALSLFGSEADPLRSMARFIVERSH